MKVPELRRVTRLDGRFSNFAAAELVVVVEAIEEIWRVSKVITSLQFTIYLISSNSLIFTNNINK